MSDLQPSQAVTDARKVLEDTAPAEWTREQLRDRIAEKLIARFEAKNGKADNIIRLACRRDADDAMAVVWPLIDQQRADNARLRASLETVLPYVDELLATVNEAVQAMERNRAHIENQMGPIARTLLERARGSEGKGSSSSSGGGSP